jgi:hypothetical protein
LEIDQFKKENKLKIELDKKKLEEEIESFKMNLLEENKYIEDEKLKLDEEKERIEELRVQIEAKFMKDVQAFEEVKQQSLLKIKETQQQADDEINEKRNAVNLEIKLLENSYKTEFAAAKEDKNGKVQKNQTVGNHSFLDYVKYVLYFLVLAAVAYIVKNKYF